LSPSTRRTVPTQAIAPRDAEIAELKAVLDHLVLTTALSKAAAELPVKPSFVPLFMARAREIAQIEHPSNGAGPSSQVNSKTIPIPEAVVYVDAIQPHRPGRDRPCAFNHLQARPSILPSAFQLNIAPGLSALARGIAPA
jgi:hypothetical protein